MGTTLQDLRFALRSLRKNPGFTITAVVALALGIGTNTAIFSVVNTVLLKPVPAPDPDRVMVFVTTKPDGSIINGGSPARFNAWREQDSLLRDISAYRYGTLNLTNVDSPEQVQWGQVSANYFRLFGLAVARGHAFTVEEDRPNAGHFVILSDGLWKRAFAADPQILGKTISLGGDPYVVVGIMTPGVETESPLPIDVWTPFQIDPAATEQNHYFTVAGRLRSGVSNGMIQNRLAVASEDFLHKFAGVGTMLPGYKFALQPMRDLLVGDVRSSLVILAGAVSFVLLIACANVANLLLVRATGRKHEIAVRLALGATRVRIIRQLLTESLVLSIAAGALGLIAGIVGIRALLALNQGSIPRVGASGAYVSLDYRVLGFTLLVSIATGVLFGLVPAFQASRADLTAALKGSNGRFGTGRHQNKARSLLVVSEVALALVLLVGSGLLIRTFFTMRSVALGFDPHNILTLQVSLAGEQYRKPSSIADLVRKTTERLRALQGVEAVAASCCLPIGTEPRGPLVVSGLPLNGTFHAYVGIPPVSPDYFDVFKIPILRGRKFTQLDDAAAPQVVIVNQALVHKFWPGGEALGAQIRLGAVGSPNRSAPMEIVGIVGDTHDRTERPNDSGLRIYIPVEQADGLLLFVTRTQPLTWMVRTRVEPHYLGGAIKKDLQQASGGLPVTGIRSMDEIVAKSSSRQDLNMALMTIFGGSALLLAAIGLYGLMAYSVQQRTQEIGIRLALGAGSQEVRNMVVWQGMRLALVGAGAGMVGAFGLTRLLESFLFGVPAHDFVVFTMVPILLSGVSLIAVWLPAVRASRVDAACALRTE
jgi:putative ABC transport system permease protein